MLSNWLNHQEGGARAIQAREVEPLDDPPGEGSRYEPVTIVI